MTRDEWRWFISGQVMQGFASSFQGPMPKLAEKAKTAVDIADALIAELSTRKPVEGEIPEWLERPQ
jgi:hypothetical protein